MTETTLTAANFALVAQLLREQCGLVLEPGKEYLVKSRLTPLAQRHRFAGIDQLIERLRGGSDNGLVTEVVEAMVTTETSFFRDIHPFETLKKTVLPQLDRASQSRAAAQHLVCRQFERTRALFDRDSAARVLSGAEQLANQPFGDRHLAGHA